MNTRATTPDMVGPWATYATLLRWNLCRTGTMLPLIVVIQVMLAVGVVVGFGLLIPDIDKQSAAFLSTGAPTVLLLVIGLVMVPQAVVMSRVGGTFAYLRTLPVARSLILLAELTIWVAVGLPSVVVAVVTGAVRYQIELAIDWPLLIGASLLTTLTATAVGYALAVALPPMMAQLCTQVLVFIVMLFSPVTFPATRLPEVLQMVHVWLPIQPAADAIRAGLLAGRYSITARELWVLAGWCVVGVTVSLRALARRA